MNLLIVESPSKAKTIEKYLGAGWKVIASVGHVRDLVPENGSVDTENKYKMRWQIMPGKEKQLKIITDAVKNADKIYLASDPDREGEAIAWHILDILKNKRVLTNKEVYRVAFHEITKNAVTEAIKNPRAIDTNLVDAYIVRRALDYLIGFGISPLLWRKNLGKSAGRVQSVAVKLIVDKEAEIEHFKPVEYWSLSAKCATKSDIEFDSMLSNIDGKKIEKNTISDKNMVDKILSSIGTPVLKASVIDINKKKISRHAYAPFTTSTLQQEASRKLYFSSKKTMSVAQKLYEQGLITYMRTDATNLSEDAISEIRKYISQKYGENYLPKQPNIYVTKSKNAQEAHEAIRPTHFIDTKNDLSGDEKKLFDLIWKRTISCQMSNAEFDSVSANIQVDNTTAIFHAVGTTKTFDGFMFIYNESSDEEKEDKETKLPMLNIGDTINIKQLNPEQHFTQPPARYTEASLVKKLEELGIGRPSTYATIMSTIVDRNYVIQDKQRRFHPTPGGWVISAYLDKYFTELIDVNFTAKTEDTLDDISNGKTEKISALDDFWKPTSKMINDAKNIKTSDVIDNINLFMHDHLFINASDICPKCGGKLGIKLSKFGAFVGCDKYPTCDYTQKLYAEDNSKNSEETSEQQTNNANNDIELGDGILFKIGRFGPYVTDGAKNASAKKYNPDTITLEIAKNLLYTDKKKGEAIELGINPVTKAMIYYYPTGRYGSYISSNKVNVSVKIQPDLSKAIELINNKKTNTTNKK